MATIIDKNGKEVLGKLYYIYHTFNDMYSTYPQKGPYLGGKVYRASANYFNITFGFKTYAPEKAAANPSSTKLMVNGVNIAVDAYEIGGSNYIKLRDLATMVNNTGKSFEVSRR